MAKPSIDPFETPVRKLAMRGDVARFLNPRHEFGPAGTPVSDHYFTPHLEFAPNGDPGWIRDAVQSWEGGAGGDQPVVIGTNRRPLPPIPDLVGGLVEHRWGRFTSDDQLAYRLRIEVTGAVRRTVRLGILLSGPDLPAALTRGGGELVQRLTGNWRHKPVERSFPTRLREVSSSEDLKALMGRLLDRSRQAPIVLVTRRSASELPVADPERLQKYLTGMAEVWSLPRTRSTHELGEAFVSRGFDPRWTCYNGGIRIFLPGFDPAADVLGKHPLTLADRLLSGADPTEAAASWALAAVVRGLGVDTWRETWRTELSSRQGDAEAVPTLGDLADLRTLSVRSSPVPSAVPSPPPVREDPPVSRGADPERTNEHPIAESADVVMREVVSTNVASPVRPSRCQRGLASLREAFDVFADLEDLLQEFQDDLESVRQERDALVIERDELSQAVQDLEHDRASREFELAGSLPALLRMHAQLSDGSLRVTDYACRKASDSRYPNLGLFTRVLAVFIAVGPHFGPIHSALQTNLGRRARARPTESPQTMAKFGKHREFRLDDGRMLAVEQHITLGHGARNQNETLQVYWRRAEDGGTEIVYVGPHLPTVSENT